jgi:nucleoside-diphosphate-sugar epimerase
MPERALFIGGPGNLSASTIQSLCECGYEVGVYSFPTKFDELSPKVRTYPGDRHDMEALRGAIQDFRPDVTLDFICFTPQEAQAVIPLVKGKVRQFVFISTVDVYGYPLARLPFHEDDPWHPETQSDYAANKRLCEEVFIASFSPHEFPLTVVRPAYSFGPRFILNFTSRDYGVHMLRHLKSGRPVLIPGDGTTLMQAGSACNTGNMIAALVDAPVAVGKDYTCGHPTFITHEGYVELFADALGVTPNPVHIPSDVIVAHLDPMAHKCLLHTLTRFNVAFSIDRFSRDFPEFRWEVTLEDWTRRVVEWNEQNGLLDAPDEQIFDDRVIASWEKCMAMYDKLSPES